MTWSDAWWKFSKFREQPLRTVRLPGRCNVWPPARRFAYWHNLFMHKAIKPVGAFSSTDFSLCGLTLREPTPHRLNPVLLKPAIDP
jgi:hypothetical protein